MARNHPRYKAAVGPDLAWKSKAKCPLLLGSPASYPLSWAWGLEARPGRQSGWERLEARPVPRNYLTPPSQFSILIQDGSTLQGLRFADSPMGAPGGVVQGEEHLCVPDAAPGSSGFGSPRPEVTMPPSGGGKELTFLQDGPGSCMSEWGQSGQA